MNYEYPFTNDHCTSNPEVAQQWQNEGFELIHEPCRGGIDDHEHKVYCGCAGYGIWHKI